MQHYQIEIAIYHKKSFLNILNINLFIYFPSKDASVHKYLQSIKQSKTEIFHVGAA